MGAIAVGQANAMLDALVGRATYTANAAVFVQLHTGDPGSAGTNNVAANTTRIAATFGSAASGGSTSNTANIDWTNVPNTETYTWVSLWTASSAGTWLGNDDLASSAAVTAGDTFRIPTGSLALTLSHI